MWHNGDGHTIEIRNVEIFENVVGVTLRLVGLPQAAFLRLDPPK